MRQRLRAMAVAASMSVLLSSVMLLQTFLRDDSVAKKCSQSSPDPAAAPSFQAVLQHTYAPQRGRG